MENCETFEQRIDSKDFSNPFFVFKIEVLKNNQYDLKLERNVMKVIEFNKTS